MKNAPEGELYQPAARPRPAGEGDGQASEAVRKRYQAGPGHSGEVQPRSGRPGVHGRQRGEVHRRRLGHRLRSALLRPTASPRPISRWSASCWPRSRRSSAISRPRPSASADSRFPPATRTTEVEGETTIDAPAKLVWVQPHMHYRGKDYELTVVYPTGETSHGAEGAQLPIRLAGGLRAREAAGPAEGHEAEDRVALRQLNGEQVQPESHTSSCDTAPRAGTR